MVVRAATSFANAFRKVSLGSRLMTSMRSLIVVVPMEPFGRRLRVRARVCGSGGGAGVAVVVVVVVDVVDEVVGGAGVVDVVAVVVEKVAVVLVAVVDVAA